MSTPTPYSNEKTEIIIVQCDKNDATLMCACAVILAVSRLALTSVHGSTLQKST